MKKSVPWNLIIPKLKQEISADEERQLETWLRSSNNEALFKELQLLWEKIQANVENYTPKTCKETLRTETDIPLRSSCMYSCCHRLLILHRIP